MKERQLRDQQNSRERQEDGGTIKLSKTNDDSFDEAEQAHKSPYKLEK